MAEHISNAKSETVGAGHVSDELLVWLQGEGATSDNLNDAWREVLDAKGFTTGNWNTDLYAYLGSLGYTGTLSDRLYELWGGTGGGPAPPPDPFPDVIVKDTYEDPVDTDPTGRPPNVGGGPPFAVVPGSEEWKTDGNGRVKPLPTSAGRKYLIYDTPSDGRFVLQNYESKGNAAIWLIVRYTDVDNFIFAYAYYTGAGATLRLIFGKYVGGVYTPYVDIDPYTPDWWGRHQFTVDADGDRLDFYWDGALVHTEIDSFNQTAVLGGIASQYAADNDFSVFCVEDLGGHADAVSVDDVIAAYEWPFEKGHATTAPNSNWDMVAYSNSWIHFPDIGPNGSPMVGHQDAGAAKTSARSNTISGEFNTQKPLTVSGWVQATAAPDGTVDHIFCICQTSGGVYYIRFYRNNDKLGIIVGSYVSSAYDCVLTSDITWDDLNQHHYIVQLDPSLGTFGGVRFRWDNGVYQDVPFTRATTALSNNHCVQFGARDNGVDNSPYKHGPCQIIDRLTTEAEDTWLYNNGNGQLLRNFGPTET